LNDINNLSAVCNTSAVSLSDYISDYSQESPSALLSIHLLVQVSASNPVAIRP